MSAQTWLEEFVPDVAFPDDLVALKYTLKKYVGARRENLEKHQVKHLNCEIFYQGFSLYRYDAGTCYFCHQYGEPSPCIGCPLYKVYDRSCYGPDSPYDEFTKGDPEPMINLISIAISNLEK